MSLSRKHFRDMAEVLRTTNASNETIEEMAWFCAKHNPHFRKDLFLEACGYRPRVRETIRLVKKEVKA